MKFRKQELFPPMQNSSELLNQKTVAVVGIGGLGSHSAEYITRMGIGTIILIDDDIVEESNLPRQGLYTQADSNDHVFKVDAATKRLKEINPEVEIKPYSIRLTEENAESVLRDADLVLDGTDNMRTRYVINDVCFALGIPWIYTAATASVGTIINFIPGKTPCFRCIFGEADEDNASCDRNGIILPILTFITSLQVTEGLKILLNLNPSTTETRYNIWTRTETSVDVSGFFDEDCSCQKPKDIKRKNSLFMICSGDSIQVNTNMDLKEIKNRLANWGFIRTNDEQQTKHDDVLIEMFACDKESISMVKNKKQWRERRIPRAVGYKTGKIVFYHIEKSQIEKWLH